MRKPLAIDPSLSMRKPFGMLILLVFLFAMSTGAAASILTDSFDFEGQDYGLMVFCLLDVRYLVG